MKYDYKEYNKEEIDGQRHYLVGEERLPSVTTILSDGGGNAGLIAWRKHVGEAEANRIVKEAVDLGTLVHQHIENHTLGIDRPGGNNVIRLQAKDLADVIISNGVKNINEIYGTEISLYYKDLYAGSADAVGLHCGEEAIIDYKTSKKKKTKDQIESYFLQGAAYAQAHNFMYQTNIRKIVIMMVVKENNSYLEFIIEGEEFDKYLTEWNLMLLAYHNQIAPKGE